MQIKIKQPKMKVVVSAGRPEKLSPKPPAPAAGPTPAAAKPKPVAAQVPIPKTMHVAKPQAAPAASASEPVVIPKNLTKIASTLAQSPSARPPTIKQPAIKPPTIKQPAVKLVKAEKTESTAAPQPVPARKTPSTKAGPDIVEINTQTQIFKFFCPACQQKLSAKFQWQGRNIPCPACKATLAIPHLPKQ